MITEALRNEIESNLNRRITSIAPLSAANNAQIYRLNCSDNSVLVAKVAENDLAIEAWMLDYLKKNTKLPVPEVFYAKDHIMVMEYIYSLQIIDSAAEMHAAELLSELHRIKGGHYGFERDTHFWSLPQPNPPSTDWVYFYGEYRLLPAAKLALQQQKIDAKTMKLAEKLCGKLSQYLKDPAPPSLIHGDIWSGNILSEGKFIKAFLDPAIYFADPEIELAYIRQFNALQEPFFRRYHELSPIRPGFFEERADIYALYPLLIHAALFGASYGRKAQKIIERFTA